MSIRLVWFKRDVRLRDHVPLAKALDACRQHGDTCLLLFLWEPETLAHPTTSSRHLQFQFQGIADVNTQLSANELPIVLHTLNGDALSVFRWLHRHYSIASIYSYEETGLLHTYERTLPSPNGAVSKM